ncbi:MAG TPA: 4Fe-4S dicluster domain-containing protein, partial [bacterium]
QKLSGSLRIEPVGDFYPAGDELTLIHLTTGRIVPPGALPIQVGCIVQNVETMYNLASNAPVTEKWLTVAGAVSEPATIRVPIGTSFRDVLSHFRISARRFIVRSGGLMMGTLEDDLDAPVAKTVGALIVLPSDHPLAAVYRRYASKQNTVRTAKSSCDQCIFCTELCPRYLLGHPVRPDIAMRNLMFEGSLGARDPAGAEGPVGIEGLVEARDPVSREAAGRIGGLHPGNAFCCECNLCTLYACPESLDPKGAATIEKKALRSKPLKWEGLPPRPHPMLPYRKVPTSRLKQRLGLTGFRDEGPTVSVEIKPDKVRLPLLQHLGKPSVAVVQKGERVTKGQTVARADGTVSVDLHASIEGRVAEVRANEIIIQRTS